MIGSRELTRGRTLALGFPSVGPTCTRWLKLVGGEMSLERTKGSFSISLRVEGMWGRGAAQGTLAPPAPETDPNLGPPGFAPPPSLGGPAPPQQRARAPAPLLPLLLRHAEEEVALALGAEQLAPAVVSEVGNVELVLLYGRSREPGGAPKSPAHAGAQGHTCTRERTHSVLPCTRTAHLPAGS